MDYLKGLANNQQSNQQGAERKEETGGGGGFMDKINSAMGGGASGEKNEDGLDKAVDWVQEHVMNAGAQNNESALEQAKDEQISDAIRAQYKNMTGKDFPVADKS